MSFSAIDYGKLIRQAAMQVDHRETDYVDAEGYVRCGICNQRRERDFTFPAVDGLVESHAAKVPMACDCDKARYKAQAKLEQIKQHQDILNNIYRKGITEPKYKGMTFDKDDSKDSKPSVICRRYADQWKDMRLQNIGILLSGNAGSGKTFRACCIANALAQREVPVLVATMPELISRMNDFDHDKSETLYFIKHWASLLVIDDLGAERTTEYAAEKAFEIIDTRYRTGKPVIVTTNIPLKDIENASVRKYERIFDRLMEMCPIHLTVSDESHRRQHNERMDNAIRNLMSDEEQKGKGANEHNLAQRERDSQTARKAPHD